MDNNNMQNKVNMDITKDSHVCEHGNCSCCGGCDKCSTSMKHYMGRRFLVLLFAILLAFFVGMKVGIIKGVFIENYGGFDNYRGGWMMRGIY